MSDKENTDAPFKNEDTIVRRAWIETALQSVRARLNSDDADQDAALAASDVTSTVGGDPFSPDTELRERPRSGSLRRPQLYVAWSSQPRRSGT